MLSPEFSTDTRRRAFDKAMVCARALAEMTTPYRMVPPPTRRQIASAVHVWAEACKRALCPEA